MKERFLSLWLMTARDSEINPSGTGLSPTSLKDLYFSAKITEEKPHQSLKAYYQPLTLLGSKSNWPLQVRVGLFEKNVIKKKENWR